MISLKGTVLSIREDDTVKWEFIVTGVIKIMKSLVSNIFSVQGGLLTDGTCRMEYISTALGGTDTLYYGIQLTMNL